MPDSAGFEGLVSLRAAYPRVPLCIISSTSGDEIVRQLRDLGASGFINKSEKRENIIAGIRRLVAGEDLFSGSRQATEPAGSRRQRAAASAKSWLACAS